MIKDNDKLLVSLIVSSPEDRDIFSIHVFANSIRFDPKFAAGLMGNPELFRKVMEVDSMWSSGTIGENDIFPRLQQAIDGHDEYLQQFYFVADELDANGRFKYREKEERFDKMYLYYAWLKKGEKLRKINRKQFERQIPDEHTGNFYVDNFNRRNAKFFSYRSTENNTLRNYYFMVVREKIKIGFIGVNKSRLSRKK